MIFIIHDPEKTRLSNGFCALDGQKPMKLPEDVRVIDMLIKWQMYQLPVSPRLSLNVYILKKLM